MTPEEFKSWFAGFTEALAGPPSDEQWKRICEQVQRIQARPTVTTRSPDIWRSSLLGTPRHDEHTLADARVVSGGQKQADIAAGLYD